MMSSSSLLCYYQPLCVMELELLLCPRGDSTSLAVSAADQLCCLVFAAYVYRDFEVIFFICTSDRRQQNTGPWLYLFSWLGVLGFCSYRFGVGSICVIRPRNKLYGSWQEHLIPGFEHIAPPSNIKVFILML